MIRKTAFALWAILTLLLAVVTFFEHSHGKEYVSAHFYGTLWFAVLWAVLAAVGLCHLIRRGKLQSLSVGGLHLSLVMILAGAALTRLTSASGTLALQPGEQVNTFLSEDGAAVTLPFSLELQSFEVQTMPYSAVAKDYVSTVRIYDAETPSVATLSMNHILRHKGYRFAQKDYNPATRTSTLAVSRDVFGIPVTYAGYLCLFFTMLLLLCEKQGRFRRLLRQLNARSLLLSAAILSCCFNLHAANTDTYPSLREPEARAFSMLLCEYQGRIAPVETVAEDFLNKLSRHNSFQRYNATEVLCGYLFFFDAWQGAPVIYIKSAALRKEFGLPKMASYLDFFDENGNYKLLPYWQTLQHTPAPRGRLRDIAELDEKIGLLQRAQEHSLLSLFPISTPQGIRWQTTLQAASLNPTPEQSEAFFAANILSYISYDAHLQGAGTMTAIEKLGRFQQKQVPDALPSTSLLRAEHLLNRIFLPSLSARLSLLLGLICYFAFLVSLVRKSDLRPVAIAASLCEWLLFAYITLALILRTIIAGRLPLGNGFETMLAVAWCLLAAPVIIATARKLNHRLPFSLQAASASLLLAGFSLLVANMSHQNPAITPLQPVLSSPLLSIHVSVIMMAYALLSFTMLNALTAFLLTAITKQSAHATALQRLSQVLLYPALLLLAVGIFVGAVWANVSWGNYWSWDPKEVWALITFFVYAAALHDNSLPVLRRASVFHAWMLLAFLCVLMTYFGVNYFLGGMHSYA